MKYLISGLNAIGFTLSQCFKNLYDHIETKEKEKKERDRYILKHFKIEASNGFWGTKIKMIQRDLPLTDDQINELLTDPPPSLT